MRFRKGKRVEWVILKQMDGEWEFWDSYTTEEKAWEEWRKDYTSDPIFRVVRYEMTMLPLPVE